MDPFFKTIDTAIGPQDAEVGRNAEAPARLATLPAALCVSPRCLRRARWRNLHRSVSCRAVAQFRGIPQKHLAHGQRLNSLANSLRPILWMKYISASFRCCSARVFPVPKPLPQTQFHTHENKSFSKGLIAPSTNRCAVRQNVKLIIRQQRTPLPTANTTGSAATRRSFRNYPYISPSFLNTSNLSPDLNEMSRHENITLITLVFVILVVGFYFRDQYEKAGNSGPLKFCGYDGSREGFKKTIMSAGLPPALFRRWNRFWEAHDVRRPLLHQRRWSWSGIRLLHQW